MNGVSVLLIERSAGGVSTRKMDCQGVWSSGTTYVTFEDVKVPVENLIGKENQGFKVVMTVSRLLSYSQTQTDLSELQPRAYWYHHPMSAFCPCVLRRERQVRTQAQDIWKASHRPPRHSPQARTHGSSD